MGGRGDGGRVRDDISSEADDQKQMTNRDEWDIVSQSGTMGRGLKSIKDQHEDLGRAARIAEEEAAPSSPSRQFKKHQITRISHPPQHLQGKAGSAKAERRRSLEERATLRDLGFTITSEPLRNIDRAIKSRVDGGLAAANAILGKHVNPDAIQVNSDIDSENLGGDYLRSDHRVQEQYLAARAASPTLKWLLKGPFPCLVQLWARKFWRIAPPETPRRGDEDMSARTTEGEAEGKDGKDGKGKRLATLTKLAFQNSFRLRLAAAATIDAFALPKERRAIQKLEAAMEDYRKEAWAARPRGAEALREAGSPVASLAVGLLESLAECDVGGKARTTLELDVAAIRVERCHDTDEVKLQVAAPVWPMRGVITNAYIAEGVANRHTGVALPGWLEDELASWLAILTQMQRLFRKGIFWQAYNVPLDGFRVAPDGLNARYENRLCRRGSLQRGTAAMRPVWGVAQGALAAWGFRNTFLDDRVPARRKLREWVQTDAARAAGIDHRCLEQADYWRELATYRFLVSPRGGGIQSPKNDEALLVYTVPITTREAATALQAQARFIREVKRCKTSERRAADAADGHAATDAAWDAERLRGGDKVQEQGDDLKMKSNQWDPAVLLRQAWTQEQHSYCEEKIQEIADTRSPAIIQRHYDATPVRMSFGKLQDSHSERGRMVEEWDGESEGLGRRDSRPRVSSDTSGGGDPWCVWQDVLMPHARYAFKDESTQRWESLNLREYLQKNPRARVMQAGALNVLGHSARGNLITACRTLQRREGAEVSDEALLKFCDLWNGEWSGPFVHYCDGCCLEGEVPNNMFAAALEVDLLQSRDNVLPSVDDWNSCGFSCGKTALGILCHDVLTSVVQRALPTWSSMDVAADGQGVRGNGSEEMRKRNQRKAWRTKKVLTDENRRQAAKTASRPASGFVHWMSVQHAKRRADPGLAGDYAAWKAEKLQEWHGLPDVRKTEEKLKAEARHSEAQAREEDSQDDGIAGHGRHVRDYGIYGTVLDNVGDLRQPYQGNPKHLPGFTSYAADVRQMQADMLFPEDEFIYDLPCPLAHPGLCATKDRWCYKQVVETAKRLTDYFSGHRRGSFHFIRVLGADGFQVSTWVSLSHVHGSPKYVLLATGTMDASTRVVSLDHRDAALHFMMGTSFLAKLYRMAGEARMPHTIGVSAASQDEVASRSLSALCVVVPETWVLEHSQREVFALPRPPAQKRPARSSDAKKMAEGLAKLPADDDGGKRKVKSGRVGVKVRMPKPVDDVTDVFSDHTVSGTDDDDQPHPEHEHHPDSDSDVSLVPQMLQRATVLMTLRPLFAGFGIRGKFVGYGGNCYRHRNTWQPGASCQRAFTFYGNTPEQTRCLAKKWLLMGVGIRSDLKNGKFRHLSEIKRSDIPLIPEAELDRLAAELV
ncbi:unnamed protein product [Prorocentrum cordatum]|uniref:Uncharacterized protein n=1 Tax=Prorocentrum cordatum TaxID=2364126 RepID=A0ABN9XLF8_9DINO|nr:unnamed protein product [Polarella glacialis]